MQNKAWFQGVSLGMDHRGYGLGHAIMAFLAERGIPYTQYGASTPDERMDYPLCIPPVVQAVLRGEAGILICGTGIGMSIGANRFPGVRAALCYTEASATAARLHNNANILVLGADGMDPVMALGCVHAFFSTSFEGGRHKTRLDRLERLSFE